MSNAKAAKSIVMVGWALMLGVGCEPAPGELREPVVRTDAVCPQGVGRFDVFVDGQVAAIGPSANQVEVAAGAVWVLESGSNTVSRFDLESEEYSAYFVDLGNERNPYGMAIDEVGGEMWVANYASNTVSVAALQSGEVLEEIDSEGFANPSAVALTEEYAFVGNVNYLGLSQGFGPGSISVIHRESREVVAQWETAFQNPHYLAVKKWEGREVLVAMTSGAYDLSGEEVLLQGEGGMEWWEITEEEPVHRVFSIFQERSGGRVGAVGRPHLNRERKRIYAVSGNAPALFAFDLEEEEWVYDAEEPFWLYEGGGDVTHNTAINDEGLLWISSFNRDGLYLLDTKCEELITDVIDLGVAANMLQGVHGIALFRRGEILEGYVILGIANGLWRVRLVPVPE